ncbi:MAG: glycosyltransferase family 2 protein [Burkholderiales bacterium]
MIETQENKPRPRLSFCIPTYNFGAFIGKTLESIISQASSKAEIIVVDGASTDNTREIVSDFQKRFGLLIYYRSETNMGVDAALAKAVELAQGDYCWLMSSDDVLVPGAVPRMIPELEHGHDIYLYNRKECDFQLNPIRKRHWLQKNTGDAVFELSDRLQLLNYLNKARSLGALFSYISSIILLRSKWVCVEHEEKLTGTNYAHVYRLFSFIKYGCSLKYINDALVLCRGENDSFLRSGPIKRVAIDLEGYHALAEKLFHEADTRNAFKSVMQWQYRLPILVWLRNCATDLKEWQYLKSRFLEFGYRKPTLDLVEFLATLPFAGVAIRIMLGVRQTSRNLRQQLMSHSRHSY